MLHLLGSRFFSPQFPFYITATQHGPIPPHQHDFFELVYMLNGRGKHSIGSAIYPIQPGDVYVISPNETHAYYPVEGTSVRLVNVLFMPSMLEESLLDTADLSGLTQLLYIEPLFREEVRFAQRLNLQGMQAYRVETLLHEMEQERCAQAPGYAIVLKNMLSTLLVLLSRAYEQQFAQSGAAPEVQRRNAVVEAALHYIETHYTEAFSLDDVARHTAMSPSRLAHLFKQHTRRSLLEYLHEYRIGRICADLLRSDAPVSQLAANQGYGDLRFFQRVFQRYTGYTPTAYRRTYKQGDS
jgi:AraC-like DNA-binding protein